MQFKKPRKGPLIVALTSLLILNLVLIAATTSTKKEVSDTPASIPVETQEITQRDDVYMDEFNKAFNAEFDRSFKVAQQDTSSPTYSEAFDSAFDNAFQKAQEVKR